MLTGSGDKAMASKALSAGALFFFTKDVGGKYQRELPFFLARVVATKPLAEETGQVHDDGTGLAPAESPRFPDHPSLPVCFYFGCSRPIRLSEGLQRFILACQMRDY